MNRVEQRQKVRRFWLTGMAVALLSLMGQLASAQTPAPTPWATSADGTTISNTNPGKVGIGTSTPRDKLEVTGGGLVVTGPAAEASGVNGLHFGMPSSTQAQISALQSGADFRNLNVRAKNVSFYTWNGSSLLLGLHQTNQGNVGVGTSSPSERLHVAGNVVSSGNLTAWAVNPVILSSTTDYDQVATTRAQYTRGGVPGTKLDMRVSGPWVSGSYLSSGDQRGSAFLSAEIHDGGTGAGMFNIGTLNAFPVTFATASAERMRITPAGNVGIGNWNPAYRLDVAGHIRASSGGFVFPDGTVQTTAATGGAATSTPSAVNVAAGQFGANVGGGTFSFPANVVINGSASSVIDSGTNNRFRVCGPNGACSVAGEYIGGRIRLSADGSFANAEAIADPGMGGIHAPGSVLVGGRVGVGTATPDAVVKLHVAGDVRIDGNIAAKYQDVAEWVPSTQHLLAGTVVVLDAERTNHVLAAAEEYDTRVAGVVSDKPGIILGEAGAGKVKVATTGRVKVRVDATHAPVKIGDLLVTSGREGFAMKSEPMMLGSRKIHAPGTIIGKALEPLATGTGEILVLLSLQ